MSSHSNYQRNSDQPEQFPTSATSTTTKQQHRRTPSASNSPHPTSRHDYHYYRHSSRRSNNYSDYVDEDDVIHVPEQRKATSTTIAASPHSPPQPPPPPPPPPPVMAGFASPPVSTSPRVAKSRTNGNKTKHRDTSMDDGTKVLISQIVATEMARQDYKEKVVALSTGSVGSSTNTTLSALTSPNNINNNNSNNVVVMKQRPPPPHRTNSSSQRSQRSTTHSSHTSSSAHRRRQQQQHVSPLVSPASSVKKDTKMVGARSPVTDTLPSSPSWNDTALLRTPSPQRLRVVSPKTSSTMQQQSSLFHSPPNEYMISPKSKSEQSKGQSMLLQQHHSSRTKQEATVVTPSPQEISPSFGRPSTTAFHVVTPPYQIPKQAPISPYQPSKQRSTSTNNRSSSATTTTHPRDGTFKNSTADVALQEAKRREREQGPTVMSMRIPKRAPPAAVSARLENTDTKDDRKRQARIERHAARQCQPLSESSATMAQASQPRSKEYSATSMKMAPDEALADAKRRARDWGPMVSTAAAAASTSAVSRGNPGVSRPTTSYNTLLTTPPETVVPTSSSSTATALSLARDDMHDAKRKERERGPSLFSALVTPRHRRTNTKKPSSNVGTVEANSALNDSDMTAIKRRERESGPGLASATGSTTSGAAVARRRTSTLPPTTSISSDDPMDDMKRREREIRASGGATATQRVTPTFVRSTPPRSSNAEASSSTVPSKPTKSSSSSSNRVIFNVDSDDDVFATDDTAYALAMARTNLERKMLQETGPFRELDSSGGQSFTTTMDDVGIRPGGMPLVGRERNAKGDPDDHGPSLAPAMSRTPQRLSPSRLASRDSIWSDTDVEAQAGVPLVTPGAFAVHGVSSHASDYTSSDDSEDDYSSGADPELDEAGGNFAIAPDAPLEAEVYEQFVLDGAVVTPTDEEVELVDPKVLKRLRFVQIVILAFALCAIGIIIGSILGFASNDNEINGPPTVQGWNQSGVDIYGPTEEPQTLFGTTVAMSGDGTRIAVASPGTGNETALNVGEVYIMEVDQNKTGTYWKTLDIVKGPGPSNAAHTSIAMTSDSQWIAIGYARHTYGSRVQIYQEVDGLWTPDSSPIVDKNGTDAAWFGYSLDISNDGNIVAIGAPQMNGPIGDGSGGVQMFQKNSNGDWMQMGSDIFGLTANEFFGWTVSFSSVMATGSYRIAAASPVSNDTTGVVRLYDWDDGEWRQVGTDLIGDVPLNRFGESIAMSEDGSILAVGVRGSAFELGQAKIYREKNGAWELDDMSFLGNEPGDGFGACVTLSGDGNVLAVGGPQSNLFGENAGIIFVYRYDPINSSWKQQGSSIGSTTISEFGMSVAISNDGLRVVGGAPTTTFDGSIARAGSAVVYVSDGILKE